MQFPGQAPVAGVIYATTMKRPDSALALALLYGLQGKREARVGGVTLSAAGLKTAAFCDLVSRFYAGPGPAANSNRTLPVGLVAEAVLAEDSPMVQAVMTKKNQAGEFVYTSPVKQISDTSEPVALIRNAITAQADGKAVILLASPATELAKVLGLLGARELIAQKVNTLVISDSGETHAPSAMQKLLLEWPTPIVLCGSEVGAAVPFPAVSIEKDFNWSPAHPVADAYRAYQKMPYQASSWDMAAALFAVRPGSFQQSPPGTIHLSSDGKFNFVPGTGNHRRLSLDPSQAAKIVQEFTQIASAKPVPRQTNRPPQQKVAEPQKAVTPQPTDKPNQLL